VLLSVRFLLTLRIYRKGAPFYNAWESRSDFQGGCETRRVLHAPSFPRPFRRLSQLLEEFGFDFLHALGGFGIAEGCGDAL